MRVCFVTTSYPQWVGDMAGHFVQSLARHLAAEQNTTVTVLCPASPHAAGAEGCGALRVRRLRYFRPDRLQKLAGGDGIPWNLRHSLTAWANVPPFLGVFFRELCRLGGKAEIIHAHWGVLGALAVFTRPLHGCGVVLTVHGSDLRSSLAPIRWMTRWAIRRADAVMTPSRQFWEDCRRVRGTARRCYFLPNGIEAPSEQELKQARQARPQSTAERMNIISVGRLVAARRHDILIRAFARVRGRYPAARLTLVGDGPRRKALADLVAQLGLQEAVSMPGRVATFEVSRYLLAADLYVSPTSIDNFGTAVVEAAAHALPVVTTRVGFPAELVPEPDGGFVVEPEDEDALTEAMFKVLQSDRRREMGLRMRRRVEELGLTWPKCAARTAEIYRRVHSGRKRPSRQ